MHNVIDEYFSEIEKLFLKADKQAFLDIKEDLEEHIAIQKELGLTETEILKKLVNPKELVAEFYEEQRLHTAMEAETDVVPLEEVKQVYLNDRKEKIFQSYTRSSRIIGLILSLIFGVIGSYALVYMAVELFKEQHLAVIPSLLLISSLIGLYCLKIWQRQKVKVQAILFLVVSSLFLLSHRLISQKNLFYYQGAQVEKQLLLPVDQMESLSIKSDFPLELITFRSAKSKNVEVIVKGSSRRNLSKNLTNQKIIGKQQAILDLGEAGLFSTFTKFEPLQVIIYLPENLKLKQFDVVGKETSIQSNNLWSEAVSVNIDSGEFNTDQISTTKIKFRSKKGDLIASHYQGAIDSQTDSGKVILKNGAGNLTLQTKNGFVSLIGTRGNKANIENNQGKLVVTETTLSKLNITSQSNIIILENQVGQTNLTIAKGKLIATNNQGELNIENNQGTLIISQDYPLSGVINSETGLVKWIQNPNLENNFELISKNGTINNNMKEGSSQRAKNRVKITNKDGDISVFEKIDSDNQSKK